ncbi:MAG: hypothetical protein C9355_02645 [Thalassolituus maritimus]|uniref:Outer membrane protein beta-barrel domain-containing protein n=1 Tax=Thalassolituus maritimus TaxID=484498 RepID=A0A1N7KV99_9GAMM|nr:hypothetical protein [Thalassolituus maritimus]TPD55563.1 MAG: hypothetical protein C9355_02645 [Thalassolituus maritimus]SIS65529.1 hypothetical protein SAMN05421686_103114 [Thalassolituus maritimus]
MLPNSLRVTALILLANIFLPTFVSASEYSDSSIETRDFRVSGELGVARLFFRDIFRDEEIPEDDVRRGVAGVEASLRLKKHFWLHSGYRSSAPISQDNCNRYDAADCRNIEYRISQYWTLVGLHLNERIYDIDFEGAVYIGPAFAARESNYDRANAFTLMYRISLGAMVSDSWQLRVQADTSEFYSSSNVRGDVSVTSLVASYVF